MRAEINRYIKVWQARCYSELPDSAPDEINDQVPSYRRIATAILKNDLGYIGIERPSSEYYGILKSIELNKPYIKHMTNRDKKELAFKLIDTLIEKNCYIKGYGDKFRVMAADHSPVMNISKSEMEILKENKIVELKGLVWNLMVVTNPFTHPVDIIIEPRQE